MVENAYSACEDWLPKVPVDHAAAIIMAALGFPNSLSSCSLFVSFGRDEFGSSNCPPLLSPQILGRFRHARMIALT